MLKGKGIMKPKQILAWDPDFTKVTEEEAERIRKAEESGFVDDSDIDWDHLDAIDKT